jgi:hypothetical protein
MIRTSSRIKKNLLTAVACATLASSFPAFGADDGAIDFGKFKPAPGAEFVEVNIKSNLIEMVTNLAKKAEPEVAEVLKGLKQIRVNVLGLTDENRKDVQSQVQKVRTQLEEKGWDRIVTVMKDSEDIGVFVKMRGATAVEGIVVTVIDSGKEAVVVNIVGDLQPEKLALVGERFDIEPLKKISGELKPRKSSQGPELN